MKTATLIIGICNVTLSLLAQVDGERPIMKESPAKLVSVIQSMAEENAKAARINVAHDATHHRIRVFSIASGRKSEEFKEYGYDFEIIYNAELASSRKDAGSYHSQHNYQILSFAAAQFVSGRKEFGCRVVGILAGAEPDLFWSSPTHAAMTIQQILTGLEKDDATVGEFLKDESEDWTKTINVYGSSQN